MPDIKWIKITTDLFDDEKISIIESMPDKDTLLVIWIKLLIMAGKVNDGGHIYLAEGVPYDEETLASVLKRPLNTVRLAMSTFAKFKMIEMSQESIFLVNFEKHQNIDGMERVRELTRARVEKYRTRHKLLPEVCNATVTFGNATDKTKTKTKIREEETRIEENTLYTQINFNEIWLKTLEIIRRDVNKPNYDTYFSKTIGLEQRNGSFIISTPTEYIAEHLRSNFIQVTTRALSEITGELIAPVFICPEADDAT